jgi:P pilus assembly chaperone PapD
MRHKILIIILFVLSTNSFGFKLSPIVQTFGFDNNNKTKTFRILNTSKEVIRLETEIFKRIISIDNKETRPDSTDFLVYPPQMELEAGASRAIRVSYVGKKTNIEEAYRLIVRQIPNKLKKKADVKTQISFLFEYVASLYVAPSDVKEKLKVQSAKKVGSNLIINFQNVGSKHVLLRRYSLELSQGKIKKTFKLSSKEFEKYGSQNILAGLERKIIFKENTSIFKTGKIKVRFIKD